MFALRVGITPHGGGAHHLPPTTMSNRAVVYKCGMSQRLRQETAILSTSWKTDLQPELK